MKDSSELPTSLPLRIDASQLVNLSDVRRGFDLRPAGAVRKRERRRDALGSSFGSGSVMGSKGEMDGVGIRNVWRLDLGESGRMLMNDDRVLC